MIVDVNPVDGVGGLRSGCASPAGWRCPGAGGCRCITSGTHLGQNSLRQLRLVLREICVRHGAGFIKDLSHLSQPRIGFRDSPLEQAFLQVRDDFRFGLWVLTQIDEHLDVVLKRLLHRW